MDKPYGYEEASAGGDFRTLPAGGYVCRILNVEEGKTNKGAPKIVVYLDIAEGEYAGYFKKMYDARKKKASDPMKVEWPFDARAHIRSTTDDGGTASNFKGFCTSVEESGGQIVWGEEFCARLKNAVVGVLFGREQSRSKKDGKLYWNTKPKFYRSVESIRNGEYEVPQDQPVADNGWGDEIPPGFEAVSDDELPFM